MKIAVLLQGQPRFCAEFDQALANFTDAKHSYDWYMYLWNPNPGPDVYGFSLIAAAWRNFDLNWAQARFRELLPPNHRVCALETGDQTQLQIPEVHHRAGETNVANVWKMFYSQYCADLLRIHSGEHYDMVIKLRPDVAVHDLDVDQCAAALEQNPRAVILSKENHHGYMGKRVNDWAAVGLPPAMTVYSNTITKIAEYCQRGVIYHPETLLSHHLTSNGCDPVYGNFTVSLRQLGRTENHCYYSNFGRWA